MPEELRQIEYATPSEPRRGETFRATMAVLRLGFSVTLLLVTGGMLVLFFGNAPTDVGWVVLGVLGVPVLLAAALVFVDVRRTLLKRRG